MICTADGARVRVAFEGESFARGVEVVRKHFPGLVIQQSSQNCSQSNKCDEIGSGALCDNSLVGEGHNGGAGPIPNHVQVPSFVSEARELV